jgi:hypothetical protein
VTYDIVVTPLAEELMQVDVTVMDDAGTVVTQGQTKVCTADEAVARDYAESIFLPDLRRNNKRLAELFLPIDAVPEPEPEPESEPEPEPPAEGGGE